MHDIDVGNAEPIKQHFYRVSPEKQVQLKKEVQYMLDNKIAEPSVYLDDVVVFSDTWEDDVQRALEHCWRGWCGLS